MTLRYSLNLISCAQILARKRKVEQVGAEDPRRAYTYFVDEKRIVQELKKQRRSLGNSPSRSHLDYEFLTWELRWPVGFFQLSWLIYHFLETITGR